MASSSNTLLPARANFVNQLRALSMAVSANLSYAATSQDKQPTRDALKFAAKALRLWEERAPHLSGVEWAGADVILAAAQTLWEEWRGADWTMTTPFGHFFVSFSFDCRGEINMGNGGMMEMVSSALKAKAKARAAWALFQAEGTERAKRAKSWASKHKAVNDLESPSPKVIKQAGGRGAVNQNPSFQKTMPDM
ncbi:hypothetical protein C0991_000514, partial [Blastosporella zonata]